MNEEVIGRHRLRLEPPDLFIVINDASVSFEDAAALMERLEAFAKGKDCVLMLFDVTRASDIAPEARKLVVASLGKLPIAGVAMFGASFSVRVVSTLMTKAASLLYPSAPTACFFATEADARAWIGERRRALA